jgi:hypothetical protein
MRNSGWNTGVLRPPQDIPAEVVDVTNHQRVRLFHNDPGEFPVKAQQIPGQSIGINPATKCFDLRRKLARFTAQTAKI